MRVLGAAGEAFGVVVRRAWLLVPALIGTWAAVRALALLAAEGQGAPALGFVPLDQALVLVMVATPATALWPALLLAAHGQPWLPPVLGLAASLFLSLGAGLAWPRRLPAVLAVVALSGAVPALLLVLAFAAWVRLETAPALAWVGGLALAGAPLVGARLLLAPHLAGVEGMGPGAALVAAWRRSAGWWLRATLLLALAGLALVGAGLFLLLFVAAESGLESLRPEGPGFSDAFDQRLAGLALPLLALWQLWLFGLGEALRRRSAPAAA